MAQALHGVIAEFDRPETLSRAPRGRPPGRLHPPRSVQSVSAQERRRRPWSWASAIPWIAAIAGFIGAGIQYGSQYWLNAVDYPLNVGGRPLHSWPAFIPATLIVAILWAGAATLIALLFILNLPRLHHPVFAVPGFERASEDRFFLLISSRDPMFEPERCAAFLKRFEPQAVREVPE